MKIPPYRYEEYIMMGCENGLSFPQQEIPDHIWDKFLNCYQRSGHVKGFEICLVCRDGREVLHELIFHLKAADESIIPNLRRKPDHHDGWRFFHPQLAVFLSEKYGSPWFKIHPGGKSYDTVVEKEICQLILGGDERKLSQHRNIWLNKYNVDFPLFIEYLEDLYRKIEKQDPSRISTSSLKLSFPLSESKTPLSFSYLVQLICDHSYLLKNKTDPTTEITRLAALDTLVKIYPFERSVDFLYMCIAHRYTEKLHQRASELLKEKVKIVMKALIEVGIPPEAEHFEDIKRIFRQKYPDQPELIDLIRGMKKLHEKVNMLEKRKDDPEAQRICSDINKLLD